MTTIINGSSPSITFSDSTTQSTAGLTGSTSQLCKAWVNFNGNTGSINGSFNVSSITVNGTGNYTINYTTAMPNTNYAMVGSAQYSTSSQGGNVNRNCVPYSYGTSGISINTGVSSASALENEQAISVVILST